MSSSYLVQGLVGMKSRVHEIECLLELHSSNVKYVGIWGMGGLGKTTLARAIYDKFSFRFEACCFLPNTREQLHKSPLSNLQDMLFSSLLDHKSLTTGTINFQLSFIKDRLCRKKVLVVIDDVGNSTNLQELLVAREPGFFGSGSRILVTSRDRQVLKSIAGDEIYNMKELNEEEATQLFSLNAFKQTSLPSGYRCETTKTVIGYAKGNPLALIVLGRRLFGKSEEDWRNALRSLRQITSNEIHDVLKTSYDALHPEMQRIFLDVACCWGVVNKDFAIKVWDSYGITTLIDLSLISSFDYFLEVHDLLQEMARRIVVDESKQPRKRSRHWNPDEICNILEANQETNAIEVIWLDMSKAREIFIEPDTFSKMRYLRMLNIHNGNRLQFSALESLPGELRHLCWEYFPKKSLPSNFNPRNLAVLELCDSKVKKLWKGTQNLVRLKKIDLGSSKHLISIPDLSKATNIEDIDLWGCNNLKEVHPSTEHLINLKSLNLRGCFKLRTLPRRLNSKVLRCLCLNNCPRLEMFPDFEWNGLRVLSLDCSGIKDAESNSRIYSALSNNFCGMKSLQYFELSNCSILESFPEILEPMNSIWWFCLTYCRNLKSLPDSIFCNLKSLSKLDLSGSAIKKLPSSIIYLKKLHSLKLNDCKYLTSFPTSINTLSKLKYLYLNSCESLHSLPELPPKLYGLEANHCKSLETISSITSDKYSNPVLMFGKCLRLKLTQLQIEQFENCNILYSGSQIPEWFSHQSKGSSITLQFPQELKQFSDIVFCVVFELKKPLRNNLFKFKASYVYNDRSFLSASFKLDHKLLGTDLVLIWHLPVYSFKEKKVTSLDFCLLDVDWTSLEERKVEHCIVRSCGYH